MSNVWKLVSNNSFFRFIKKRKIFIYLIIRQLMDFWFLSSFFLEICVLTYLYYCMHTGNGAVGG